LNFCFLVIWICFGFRISCFGFGCGQRPRRGFCVKKISQKYQIMQNKPNFQNAQNVLTLVNARNYNELWDVDYYAKQTQSNPISAMVENMERPPLRFGKVFF